MISKTISPYKILIIMPRYNLGNKKNYQYNFPLGLGYISAILKKEGYAVDCLNLNHLDGSITDLVKIELNKKNYDFVGVGNTALEYVVTESIIRAVREHKSKPKIILGGAIITTQPAIIFNDLKPDFGIIGEGEETILELLECLKKEKDLKKVNGIIYRDKNKKRIITPKRNPPEDLDSLPIPDFEGFGFEEQLKHSYTNTAYLFNASDFPRVYPILCSRSCPFQCTFCYHEGKYRARSIDNIMEELNLMVKKYKINSLMIYDDCFAIDEKRFKEFCKRIKELRAQLSWNLIWTPQLTVKGINDNLMKLLKEAGCEVISYGFESYSPIVLKSMGKPITPEEIDNALRTTLKYKIGVQANFIFGDIAETKRTAYETLNYWKNNAGGQVSLRFIQPYPGSKIYQHCLKKGIIKNELNFVKNLGGYGDLVLNMTDKMTDEDIFQLKKDILTATSKYCRFAKPIKIKKIGEKVYNLELRCPYCKKEMIYKNCFIDNILYYGSFLMCRNCRKRFFLVTSLKRLVFEHYYKFYNAVKKIRMLQVRFTSILKKIKFKLLN